MLKTVFCLGLGLSALPALLLATETETPTASPTLSQSATVTPSRTPTATRTNTPTVSPTASISPTWTASPTVTPVTALVVASGQTLNFASGTYYFTSVDVQSGGTLGIYGQVFFVLSGDFNLQPTAMIDGNGRGYAGGSYRGWGQGPGGGGTDLNGGGGGHGGKGGSAYYSAAGGAVNDDAADPTLMGSGGGGSANLGASPGGAAFILDAPGRTVVLDGTIRMDGWPKASSGWPGSGGGAGGTISVKAGQISGNGALSAKGGDTSGSLSGGAGGGGCINLCSSGLMGYSGGRNVSGGLSTDTNWGQHGSVGKDYTCASPPTFTHTRTVAATFTVSPTPTITVTFTATPTATVTVTPGYAESGLDRSVLAPVPVKRGQPLCLYFEDQPAQSELAFYNVAGELALEAGLDAQRRPCVATSVLAPGIYLVRLKIQLLGRDETIRWQKLAVLP